MKKLIVFLMSLLVLAPFFAYADPIGGGGGIQGVSQDRINDFLKAPGTIGGTTPAAGAFTTLSRSTANTDNQSDTQTATTAYAKTQDAVLSNPKAMSQAVNITAGATASIAVADNDNIDFGTGDFTLVWKGSLPDWTPAAFVYPLTKYTAGGMGYALAIDNATPGRIAIAKNGNVFYSTVTSGNSDGTVAEIAVVVVFETAGVAGSITFYVNGLQLGNASVIAAGAPNTISNGDSLQVTGLLAERYAGTVHHAYTYNRALTAAEVLDLYRNGPQYKHTGKDGSPASQTAQTSGTLDIGKEYTIDNWITDDDFANVGGANVDGTVFVATGTTPTKWTNSSSLRRTGTTLLLRPSGIKTPKWYDESGNALDASYPTTGSTLTLDYQVGTESLLSVTNVSLAADADTTIYTVPTGRRLVLTKAILIVGADAGTTVISIGADTAETNWLPNNTLSALDAANDVGVLMPVPNATTVLGKSYAAGTVIQAKVSSQAGGATNSLRLFGYLY